MYGQINYQFNDLADKNWNLLYDANLVIQTSENEKLLEHYVEQMKEQWGFNTLLFLDENSSYVDTDGHSGYLNLGRDFSRMVQNKENIVVDGSLSGADPVVIFAIPVERGTYRGSSYTAVALGYDKKAIADTLMVNAFGGSTECYIIYPDGRLFDLLAKDTTNVFMIFAPGEHRAIYVSPNVQPVLGVSAAAILQDINVLGAPQYVDGNFFGWEGMEQIPLDETVTLVTIRRHGSTGKKHYFQEIIYHISVNETERFILVISDRTEDRQNQERLRTALEIARTADQSKSMFLSNMSHDIRTPMNAIIGLLPLTIFIWKIIALRMAALTGFLPAVRWKAISPIWICLSSTTSLCPQTAPAGRYHLACGF